jgi:hypothetical protein
LVEGNLLTMILSGPTALDASTPCGWDSLAASLGCSQKVSQGARAGGAHYLTEYLPRDQSIAQHTRRFTVTVYPLSSDPLVAADQAGVILDSITSAAREAGAGFREFAGIPTAHGNAAFLDYSLAGKHVAAAAVPMLANALTVFQLSTSNGAIPSLADVLLIRSLTASR